MASKTPIPGELESKAVGGIVADYTAIRAGKKDSETLDKALETLDAKITRVFDGGTPESTFGGTRHIDGGEII